MDENIVFTSLLTEIAKQLGVEISMNGDEELTFDFEDGLTGVISHLADRCQILLEAGVPLPDALSDQQSADLAWILLRMNALLMPEHSMSIASGEDHRIGVISVISQEAVNAIQLADSFEAVMEKGRWVRSLLGQLVSGQTDASEEGAEDFFSNTSAIKI